MRPCTSWGCGYPYLSWAEGVHVNREAEGAHMHSEAEGDPLAQHVPQHGDEHSPKALGSHVA